MGATNSESIQRISPHTGKPVRKYSPRKGKPKPKDDRGALPNPLFAGGAVGYGFSGSSTINSPLECVNHYRSAVYIAVSNVARLCSKAVPVVVRKTDPGDESKSFRRNRLSSKMARRALSSSLRSKNMRGQTEEFEYLEDFENIPSLLRNPSPPPASGANFWKMLWIYHELCGVAYIFKLRDESGRVVELWNVPSYWVREVPDLSGETNYPILGYQLTPYGGRSISTAIDIPLEDMIVLKDPDPRNWLNGYSPAIAGAQIIDLQESAEACRLLALKAGSNIGNVIILDTDSQDEVTRFEQHFRMKFQGDKAFNAPLILSRNAKFEANAAIQEVALGETAKQVFKDVLSLWGLGESVVGKIEDVSRAAYETAMSQCADIVINPRLEALGQVLTTQLANEFEDDGAIEIFFEDQSPVNDEEEDRKMQIGIYAQAVTMNEVRVHCGLEPLPDSYAEMPLAFMGQIAGQDGQSGGGLSRGPMSADMSARGDSGGPDLMSQISRLTSIQQSMKMLAGRA